MPPDLPPPGPGGPAVGRDWALLSDMLHSARAVSRYVAGRTFENYLSDEMLRDAVERRVEIIGEAARGVSQPFQASHPQIPWRPIMAQRHVLAHEYAAVRHDLIWKVATFYVPELIGLLEPLIPPPPPDPEPQPPSPPPTKE